MDVDLNQLERASLAVIQRRREYDALRRPRDSRRQPRRVDQPTLGQLLQSRLARSGLDVDELGRRLAGSQKGRGLARTQSELHEQFQQQRKDAAVYLASDEAAFRAGVQRKIRDVGHFPASVVPLTNTPILLDKPFMILQLPRAQLDIFTESHLESGNSWVKLNIDKNGDESGEDAHFSSFNFYYMWTNDSEFTAVINVDTMLRFTGFLETLTSPGLLVGGYTNVWMGARLDLLEWWNQTPDGPTEPLDQDSQKSYFTDLEAWGEVPIPFASPIIFYVMFPGRIIDLSYSNWIVPAQSTAIIVVNVGIEYKVLFGEFDRVIANFASDEDGYSIISPWVELTLLTRPGAFSP